ncbi:hypothetical protein LPW11_02285 [Geomonas sp. RF6]|uniref:hypothetical protein n=1 Tax=Geomonas sp. RF6 TaxID=2897342 RepID=UPI001E288F69|nr:hypothetical protein [Geomonas sp. RF6]UFS71026.1 hypothetical protein LPW11_02285 [Geomonas sp. RF6]
MTLKKGLQVLLFGAVVGMLGACGGGGGSKVENTVVSGVVSKGIFTSGSTVRIYGVAQDGTKTLLKEDTVKAGGVYSTDLGTPYTGAILVEAFGTYTDEATNATVTVPADAPLKAAVPSAATATTVVVTPLTDLAVRKATVDGKLSVGAIAAANTDVASVFQVDNIISTKPVAFEATALKAATPAQQKYTEVLALVSQYVANAATSTPTSADLQNSLATLSSAVTLSSGSAAATISSYGVKADLVTAVNDLLAGPNTSTVLASDTAAKANLAPVTGVSSSNKLVSYYLNVSGVTGAVIAGLQADVALTGLGVANGDLSSAALFKSGVLASSSDAALLGYVKSEVVTLGLYAPTQFGNGQFGTIYLEVPKTANVPASSMVVSNVKVVDLSSVTLTGATVTVEDGPVTVLN